MDFFAGNGDGTFEDAVLKSTGNGPWGIAAGDFTNKGALDVVISDKSSNTIFYFLNLGILGNNGPCCGDDGALDTFSNSTHSCCSGVFTVGSCS